MSLTVSNYMKQYYKGNVFGATENGRHGQKSRNLLPADLRAVQRAVRDLGDYDYDTGEGGELMNKVQAFVSTYNNYIDSAKGLDDSEVSRHLSKMKKMTKEYALELEEIGIKIQSSGQLKVDKKALQDTSRYSVSQLFSKDADYGKMTEKQMKQTYRLFYRKNLNLPGPNERAKQSSAGQSSAGTAAALAQQPVVRFTGNHIDCLL